MSDILQALYCGSRYRPAEVAMADDHSVLTRGELLDRVAGLAGVLEDRPQTLGLLGANGTEWAVAQLAAWAAGKTVVPLPTFFSRAQLEHVLKDAGVDHVIATRDAGGLASTLGVDVTPALAPRADAVPEASRGGGMIVYTSGSTGHPKGVRLGLDQIERQARTLAAAIEARPDDSYLSVLPLSLLLETIAAICVPVLVGARTHFASAVAERVAAGRPSGLRKAFETWRPTTSVLVPQLLSSWITELEAAGERAPNSLRFVAVGGAGVSEALAARAWDLGIPAHEGYGLTECCSVVALNRPGRRRAGTVGEPLPGLDVMIDQGEVVVRGPTVMQGYLHGARVTGPWRTGDLGSLTDGFLVVTGRKDTLIVAGSGRNISPEWVEAMVMSDPGVAACIALADATQQIGVVLIPSAIGERRLIESPRAHLLLWLERLCIDAPTYAVPKDFVVCPPAQAKRLGLLTTNGRIVREAAARAYPALKLARSRAAA
jgi:long-subunit acyl-CoA synthetase (AMP-forming)